MATTDMTITFDVCFHPSILFRFCKMYSENVLHISGKDTRAEFVYKAPMFPPNLFTDQGV